MWTESTEKEGCATNVRTRMKKKKKIQKDEEEGFIGEKKVKLISCDMLPVATSCQLNLLKSRHSCFCRIYSTAIIPPPTLYLFSRES